jgi:hypothetical protein
LYKNKNVPVPNNNNKKNHHEITTKPLKLGLKNLNDKGNGVITLFINL